MSIAEYFILLFSLLISFVNSEKLIYNNESDFSDSWVLSEFSLFPTLPIALPYSPDEQCREDSRKLILNLKNRTFWAIQSKFLFKNFYSA